jgi:hypothetical protein
VLGSPFLQKDNVDSFETLRSTTIFPSTNLDSSTFKASRNRQSFFALLVLCQENGQFKLRVHALSDNLAV